MLATTNRTKRLPLAIIILSLALTVFTKSSQSQTPEPQRDQLLNGLKIVLISRPGDPNVLLKLRIHSGAAFDIAGKNGLMSLLGEMLFPDPVTFEYFTNEINGRLAVETGYDSIDVTMQGRAGEYDRIVDTLRVALVNTPLTPENVTKIRDARVKALAAMKPSAADLADQLIASRLYDTFPYANPVAGTAESVGRIERADLMIARDRFLSPNNATLVIVGGVDHAKAMRALRQLLGGWRKSDELVPGTFRSPTPADARVLVANYAGSSVVEVRLATRGLARGDRDYAAANLLASVIKQRWQKLVPNVKISVKHDAHALPGMLMMSATADTVRVAGVLESARAAMKSTLELPPFDEEIAAAKAEVSGATNNMSADEKLATTLLNNEAYSLPSLSDQMKAWNTLAPADVQRVATRLFKDAAVASVVVGNANDLKTGLASLNVEILGEAKPNAVAPQAGAPKEDKTRHTHFVFPAQKNTHPVLKPDKTPPKPD